MKVEIKTEKENIQLSNVWNIQSNVLNNSTREVVVVGYDHIVHARMNTKEIKSISIEFEG